MKIKTFLTILDLPFISTKNENELQPTHCALLYSKKSRQVVKIIVNVELVVVMVVVVRLVVVNGWRRRGDKSTATAARPPHHCNRPRWTCKQPIQSPQPSHKLPASAAHHPQITGMEEDSSMSRNVHFTYYI